MTTTDQHASIARQIAELDGLTVGQLQEKWEEVWQEPCRSRNKDNLKKRIAWKIQANAYGGLSQRALDRARDLADETLLRVRNTRILPASSGGETVIHRFAPQVPGSIYPRWQNLLPMHNPSRTIFWVFSERVLY